MNATFPRRFDSVYTPLDPQIPSGISSQRAGVNGGPSKGITSNPSSFKRNA